MKKQVLTLAVCLTILLYGCPYYSHHTIGNPGTEEIDFALSGTWENTNRLDKIRKIEIKPVNKYEYRIELVDADQFNQVRTNNFTGFLTHVEGKPILYVRPNNGQREVLYYYFTYQVDVEGTLHLRAIDNTKVNRYQTVSREQMVEYFRSNIKTADFFTPATQYRRLITSNAQLN